MQVAVINSGGANITSVMAALDRLGAKTIFTDNPKIISSADKVILPGVGAAGDAMKTLEENGLVNVIKNLKQPVLGICLGMQLLFDTSEEGNVEMLGMIKGAVKRFSSKPGKIIPHMGWNTVTKKNDHPLLMGVEDNSYFYFVHSYFVSCIPATIGACAYDEDFSAIVAQDNIMGCQFHPERSGKAGVKVLENFLALKL